MPTTPKTDFPHIVFIGKMGAGKTTAAQFLVQRFGYERHSFADAIREVAVLLWGASARTDRTKLIGVGVKMREIDPDVWLDRLIYGLDVHRTVLRNHNNAFVSSGKYIPVVIDDARFPNELVALRERGFVVVRIEADAFDRIARLKGNGKLDHEDQLNDPSETAIDDAAADYTIQNTDDFAEFYGDVVRVLEREARKS